MSHRIGKRLVGGPRSGRSCSLRPMLVVVRNEAWVEVALMGMQPAQRQAQKVELACPTAQAQKRYEDELLPNPSLRFRTQEEGSRLT